MPIVTLLTDFGTADGYVAEMKGVLLSLVPGVTLVDMSHDIPPQDVEAARLAIARFWRRFPPGTIHVVVVDPGVGTTRAALAVASGGQYLVGPDNGVLSPALFAMDAEVVELPVPATAARTFQGRDVFAPAAAYLANGAPLQSIGEAYYNAIRRRTPEALRREDGAIAGEVLTVDRFGNAITNIVARVGGTVLIGGRALPVERTYSDVDPGQAVAVIGSTGFIEIALRDGNAAVQLEITRGDEVLFRRAEATGY